MAGRQQGQILYLNGSSNSRNGPGGSLSTRFQKLAQSRTSAITVVNQDAALHDPSAGRGLGLGLKTGSSASGQKGARISTNRNAPITSTGLHTAGGLARAMQERGTGVSDAFLLAPALVASASSSSINTRPGNQRKGRGASLAAGGPGLTRASKHKAMVLGGRPGKKNLAGKQEIIGKPVKPVRGGPPSNKPAVQSGKGKGPAGAPAQGGKGGKPGKGKGKGGKKPAPSNASSLDNELDEYMMKNEHTAASMLDNDLDSYMSERLDETAW